MDRLSMSSALIARARTLSEWIGDDHGDRYEAAMLSGVIPDEMQIVVKEILDHLRSALDYCAQEIWRRYSGQPDGAKVYFPIAQESAKESDFLSLMNRHMPGVPKSSPQAYETFKNFQAFYSDSNAWLPDLATLANKTKHDHLEVASMPQTIMNYRRGNNGLLISSFAPGHGPKRGTPWMLIKATSPELSEGGAFEVVFLQLKDIRMELSSFLQDSISGVNAVIAECRKLTTSP